MPIHRRSNSDPDWMARMQDEELKSLEKRISALYEEARHDVTEEYNRFFTDFQLEYENRLAKVESGEIPEADFQRWCRNNILQSNQYQSTIRMLTDVLVNADVAAMATVNEQLPYTLAESYDFISSLGFEAADKAGISMGTFQIYNADSVQAIIRDNPDLLPVVDLPEDELWNRNHINNEITQAIIQGDSMQQVAQRLQRVASMDNNAAIRNARTAMTAAENLGRSESARRLRQRGLPVEEVWSATLDGRTRDSHLLLDGTKKDENGYYGVGILNVPLRFPADPRGEGKEIYNCRCRENVQIAGIDHSRDDELYEQFMQENHPEDWAELQSRRADPTTGEGRRWQERQDALERQARLRRERQVIDVPPMSEQNISTTPTPTQEQLREAIEKHGEMWDLSNEARYDLASEFAQETANEENFFMNSIGYWQSVPKRPRGEPSHVSYNRRTGKKSSEYWYTAEGVIRGSDHWGADVASCSWFIEGRRYGRDGVTVGRREYAFISWEDLKPKGLISFNRQTGVYGLVGFRFEK